MKKIAAASLLILSLVGACAGPSAPPTPWRGGWTGLHKPDEQLAAARELGFNALIVGGDRAKLQAFAKRARAQGVEVYWWFSLVSRAPEMQPFMQVMTPEEERLCAEIKADADPKKHGYQFGGEPLPGRKDVLAMRILCFHRPEVVEWSKRQIKETLDACPDLAGIGFDYIGYQNYTQCHCPVSKRLQSESNDPDFALHSLVDFNNELAAYVRQVRPGAKVVTHVYPVFLPAPLYGRLLNVDYCCQTVAWFFEPCWTDEKITAYTRTVVEGRNPDYPDYRGVPFVGVYINRPYADKSPERFARDLRLIRRAASLNRLSICSYAEILSAPAMQAALKAALE